MLPTITIVVSTYNEERHIASCLDSVFKQDYPKKLLEVFVVDNYSTDKTITIAKKYPVKVIMSRIKNNHVSKMIALKRSTCDLFYYMDADLEFADSNYLKLLVLPLLDDSRIVGASGKVVQMPGDTNINRFLTHEFHQRDPVLEFFSPVITSTFIEKKSGYFLCRYTRDNIPPVGRCLFWRKKLLQTPIAKAEKFLDLDNIVLLVKHGFDYFAFVPDAREYHRHVEDLKSLIQKRLRNIIHNFLPHYETREYTWFNLRNKRDVLKIIYWLIYAHLIFPALIRGVVKAVRYKDIYCIFYEPILTVVLTDITVYGFLANRRGLKFLSRIIK